MCSPFLYLQDKHAGMPMQNDFFKRCLSPFKNGIIIKGTVMDNQRKELDLPEVIAELGWKYHHLGIPTEKKMENERYLPEYKMYISGFEKSPYGIEWIRFETEADFPDIVKSMPHLAFTVPDIHKALVGKKVIIEPNSPSEGVIVAFIEDSGAPIELIQEPLDKRKKAGTKEIVYSERVYLADMDIDDAGALYGYRALLEVYQYQSWFPGNISDAEEFIKKYSVNSTGEPGNWKQYGIYLSESNELIGDCGYCPDSDNEAEIGYTISPGFQRRGLGEETVSTLINHLFKKKGIERIIASTDPENIPSIKLLEKLGFTVKEYKKESLEIRGEMKDDLIFELNNIQKK